MDTRHPRKIGKYELIAKVAQGGMGALYKARHPTLDRVVLLKKLEFRGGSGSVERFRREARLMMDFKNEHIVQVYDHFKEGSHFYIVEEYVDGISLEALIRRERYLSTDAAMLIFLEVCKALKYAHDKQVIHRDILIAPDVNAFQSLDIFQSFLSAAHRVERSGGFGAHNVNMLFHNPSIDHSDNIIYMTYTNAGLRVFDIADARLPKEIGYFVPPDRAPKPGEDPKNVVGSSNGAEVVVDSRGYIYMSDRSQGIWVLRYTGPKPGPAIPVH